MDDFEGKVEMVPGWVTYIHVPHRLVLELIQP